MTPGRRVESSTIGSHIIGRHVAGSAAANTSPSFVSHSPSRAEPDSRLGSLSRRSLFSRGPAPAPRRSEGSISFTMQRPGGDDSPSEVRSRRTSRSLESPVRAGSVSGRESQGEVTASLDALDDVAEQQTLAGFARADGDAAVAEQAYFAWRAHSRVARAARPVMVGSPQVAAAARDRVGRRPRSFAPATEPGANGPRVRQWRARWHWRRCALGFVCWTAGEKMAPGRVARFKGRGAGSTAAGASRGGAHVADIARR